MITRYNNLIELLDHAFEKYADLPAYSCMGHTLTYRELDDLTQRFASYLQHDLGLQAGDRIAIQMPNILQYPVAMYGALRAGLIVVNTNPLYTGREVKHQLIDSGAKAIIVLANVASCVASIISETDVKHVIVTNICDLHPTPKKQIINFVVKYIKKMVPKYSFPNEIAFCKTLSKPAQKLKAFTVEPETLVALQYTGGTTGVSKGAMLTHKNLASNVWQMVSHLPDAFIEGKETFIACLPLYHIYAYNLHGLCAFSYGEHNVLIPNPRDLDAMIDTIKDSKMTVFIGINTLYVALAHHPRIGEVDFSHLKISSAGGMAMTENAANQWEKLTGCKVSEGYGLTETSPVLCGNKVDDIRKGSIGVPLVETEIKLVDEDGNTVGPGEVGEICARGPQVMAGYWNRPNETAKVLTNDGWLLTGDMGVKCDDGHYKIVDRKKDMILVSGFNVYPNEIEDVVSQHSGVLEAAAVGIPDERTGEAVKLFVVPATKELTKEEVVAFCRENLTAYKRPKIIEFRESLPKTNVGKILRRELRDSA